MNDDLKTTVAAVLALLALLLALWLASLAQGAFAAEAPPRDPWQAALEDAAVPTPAKRRTDLIAITADAPGLDWRDGRVKMLAWLSEETYAHRFAGRSRVTTPAGKPALWLTAVPEVRDFCHALETPDPTPRLKQYLGLSPAQPYDVFVELWVSPADLRRPCPDDEIHDHACEVDSGPPAAGRTTEPGWWADLYRDAYHLAGRPWTRLGYTYDWGGDGRGGASEFVVLPAATVRVVGAYTTAEYCGGARVSRP